MLSSPCQASGARCPSPKRFGKEGQKGAPASCKVSSVVPAAKTAFTSEEGKAPAFAVVLAPWPGQTATRTSLRPVASYPKGWDVKSKIWIPKGWSSLFQQKGVPNLLLTATYCYLDNLELLLPFLQVSWSSTELVASCCEAMPKNRTAFRYSPGRLVLGKRSQK